jgi:hypothetical protein
LANDYSITLLNLPLFGYRGASLPRISIIRLMQIKQIWYTKTPGPLYQSNRDILQEPLRSHAGHSSHAIHSSHTSHVVM